jgi:hypothetical protein
MGVRGVQFLKFKFKKGEGFSLGSGEVNGANWRDGGSV